MGRGGEQDVRAAPTWVQGGGHGTLESHGEREDERGEIGRAHV